MPKKSANPVKTDKTKAQPTKIAKAVSDEAEIVSTYKFITPVSTLACKNKESP